MHTFPHRMDRIHPIAAAYENNFERLSDFFDYAPNNSASVQSRVNWLDESKHLRVNRHQLVEVLDSYNRQIGAGERAIQHIELLKRDEAICVVGGQQAGLLTGPIYTIYKAICLVQWARKLTEELGRPVVPIFWIAGEDHDWEEINHVYVPDANSQPVKFRLPFAPNYRASASHWKINQGALIHTVEDIFKHIPDTPHKAGLVEQLHSFASKSDTMTSFFARIMAWLFEEEGLVFVDSADPALRTLQTPLFEQLIHRNADMHEAVFEQAEAIRQINFSAQLELEDDDAHLFIYEQGERLLLYRRGDHFATKTGGYTYTAEQLLTIARNEPNRLSTNVFFRTLMQEYLFPAAVTVLGPGEIAYWALFGRAFHELGFKMPLIASRFGGTIVDHYAQKWMAGYQVSFDQATQGLGELKERLLDETGRTEWNSEFERMKEAFIRLYEPLVLRVVEQHGGLSRLATSNVERIVDQIAFLQHKTELSLKVRIESDLQRLDYISGSLWPNDKPQERIYSVFTYISCYGWDWWVGFKNLHWDVQTPHRLIYL